MYSWNDCTVESSTRGAGMRGKGKVCRYIIVGKVYSVITGEMHKGWLSVLVGTIGGPSVNYGQLH